MPNKIDKRKVWEVEKRGFSLPQTSAKPKMPTVKPPKEEPEKKDTK